MPDSAAEDSATEAGSAGALPQLRVSGAFASRVTFVTHTSTSLLVGLGAVLDATQAETLVPYVELRIDGLPAADAAAGAADPDTRGAPILQAVLTLEMAAYLFADLAADIHGACRQLSRVGSADLRPEPGRLARAVELFDAAAKDLSGAADVLRR